MAATITQHALTLHIQYALTPEVREAAYLATGVRPVGGVITLAGADLTPEERAAVGRASTGEGIEIRSPAVYIGRSDTVTYALDRGPATVTVTLQAPVSGEGAAREALVPALVAFKVERDLREVERAERERLDGIAQAERGRLEAIERTAREAAAAQAAAVKAEAQARSDAERDAVRAVWARDHATDEQRRRLAAGLLPDAERSAGIEALRWAWAADLRPYAPLTASDIQHGEPDEDEDEYDTRPCGGRVTFSSGAATEATTAEFAALEAVRAAVPAVAGLDAIARSVVTLRRHSGVCSGGTCPGPVRRAGILAVLTTPAGREFRREFAV